MAKLTWTGISGAILAVWLLTAGGHGFNYSDPTISTSCGPINVYTSNLPCCMCGETIFNETNGGYFSYNTPWSFERDTSSWDSYCRWGTRIADCMATRLPQCDKNTIGDEILRVPDRYKLEHLFGSESCTGECHLWYMHLNWRMLLRFYSRVCDKSELKATIKEAILDPAFDPGVTCLEGAVRRNMYRCYMSLVNDFVEQGSRSIDSVYRLFESILNCMFSVLNQSPCNTATRRVMYLVSRMQMPSFILDENLNVDESTSEDFQSKLRCTVGVYGDPHLKTCWSWETCSAPGQQNYFSNRYLVIKGENREIGRQVSPRATTLVAIEIRFLSIDGDKEMASYSVSDAELKPYFDGGETAVGGGSDRVEIHQDPSNRIRFVQRGTGAVLILRQWAGNYFFTLRMAQNVVLTSSGLLVEGCPLEQVVDIARFALRKRRDVTESECSTVCLAAAGDNIKYRKTCVFDCLTTDSTELAREMTSGAIADQAEAETFDDVLREGAYKHGDNGGAATATLWASVVVGSWTLLLVIFGRFN